MNKWIWTFVIAWVAMWYGIIPLMAHDVSTDFQCTINLTQEAQDCPAGPECPPPVICPPPVECPDCPTCPEVPECPEPPVDPCDEDPSLPECQPIDPQPPEPPVDPQPGDYDLTWEAPTEREESPWTGEKDPLAPEDICAYILEYKTGDSTWEKTSLPPTPLTYNLGSFSPAIWDFRMYAVDCTPETPCKAAPDDWEDYTKEEQWEWVQKNNPPYTCGGPFTSGPSDEIRVALAVDVLCKDDVPQGVTATASDAGIEFTWKPRNGCSVIVQQCKASAQAEGKNCWDSSSTHQNPTIEAPNSATGSVFVPKQAIDYGSINSAGECGFRLRFKGGEGTGKPSPETWGQIKGVCTE